jgi:hypothetical protein
LADDIGESKNLAVQMPDRARKMQVELASWRADIGARMPTTNPKYDLSKADQWWSRRTNKPLDLKAMGDRFEQRASKPYFRTK